MSAYGRLKNNAVFVCGCNHDLVSTQMGSVHLREVSAYGRRCPLAEVNCNVEMLLLLGSVQSDYRNYKCTLRNVKLAKNQPFM